MSTDTLWRKSTRDGAHENMRLRAFCFVATDRQTDTNDNM